MNGGLTVDGRWKCMKLHHQVTKLSFFT